MPRFWPNTRSASITLSQSSLNRTSWDFGIYAELVRNYTERSLFKDMAVLLVFSSIVMSKLEYFSGMPFIDLLNALVWKVEDDDVAYKGIVWVRKQRLPSWFCDGWTCSVKFPCWQPLASAHIALDFARRYEEINETRQDPSSPTEQEIGHIGDDTSIPVMFLYSHVQWKFTATCLTELTFEKCPTVFLRFPTPNKDWMASRLCVSSEIRTLLIEVT